MNVVKTLREGIKMRVLIADDSAVMRRIVRQALEKAALGPMEVLEAGNGAEGLAVLERERALDLMLCDIHMPIMDGLVFLRTRSARGLAPEMPVVMITADASDPMLQEAVRAGAQDFISKPFSPAQVTARVLPLLRGIPSTT